MFYRNICVLVVILIIVSAIYLWVNKPESKEGFACGDSVQLMDGQNSTRRSSHEKTIGKKFWDYFKKNQKVSNKIAEKQKEDEKEKEAAKKRSQCKPAKDEIDEQQDKCLNGDCDKDVPGDDGPGLGVQPYNPEEPVVIPANCNPLDPTSQCYKDNCNPLDPNGACYDPDCKPHIPNNKCYDPMCNPLDSQGKCYVPNCNPLDVTDKCYDPNCKPSEKDNKCYITNCNPLDSEGKCYIPNCNPLDPNGNCYDPDCLPSVSDNKCYLPNCNPLDPQGKCFTPNCNPLDSESKCYDPNCKPSVPDNKCYTPDCNPLDPNGKCFTPNCNPLDANGECYDPNCKPSIPDNKCYNPDCNPLDPNGKCYTPDCDPLNPNDKCFDPECKPDVPGNKCYTENTSPDIGTGWGDNTGNDQPTGGFLNATCVKQLSIQEQQEKLSEAYEKYIDKLHGQVNNLQKHLITSSEKCGNQCELQNKYLQLDNLRRFSNKADKLKNVKCPDGYYPVAKNLCRADRNKNCGYDCAKAACVVHPGEWQDNNPKAGPYFCKVDQKGVIKGLKPREDRTGRNHYIVKVRALANDYATPFYKEGDKEPHKIDTRCNIEQVCVFDLADFDMDKDVLFFQVTNEREHGGMVAEITVHGNNKETKTFQSNSQTFKIQGSDGLAEHSWATPWGGHITKFWPSRSSSVDGSKWLWVPKLYSGCDKSLPRPIEDSEDISKDLGVCFEKGTYIFVWLSGTAARKFANEQSVYYCPVDNPLTSCT